ncbi:cellulose-binding protein [Echinicola soli]|uniref:Cellulose-binding protein n=1 Tax=Echinicola soli TaxID=2591634 RepID=A0A514CMX7_9BACT|nr:cellulose-binding protein [Echinicola soli]QDH81064.1 cellulose-binding protein [Echinicola soli]
MKYLFKPINLRKWGLYVLTPLMMLSCVEDTDKVDKAALLEWEAETLSEEGLPAGGGSVSVNVDWAYTQWNIRVEEVLEGEDFIDQITPRTAGNVSIEATSTAVTIRLKENPQPSQNVVRLELRSLDEDISHSVVLTQAAKEIDPVMVHLDPNTRFQTISGFGGGNMMWGFDYLNAEEIKLAFGTGAGELGLSIYRVRLSPVREDWPALVETVKEARKYGARIIASPWSPPAAFKSNHDLIGGHLLEAHYADYADYLNDFVQFMAGEGSPVDVVSIQNEPDIQVSYESCDWTVDQVYDFIKNHGDAIQGAQLTAAESFNFKQSYTDQILNDSDALENLDIVSGHIYGSGLAPYPLAEEKGVEVWMTEYLMNQNSGVDINNWNTEEAVIWEESMGMLETIHGAMTSNWNAYIWWYIRRFYSFLGDGEQGTSREQTLRRGHAMAQFAKYVRPGYERIWANYTGTSANLGITAYEGNDQVVVVLINWEENPLPEVWLDLPVNISEAVSYTTSVTKMQEETKLTLGEETVTVALPAKSITTVVMDK